MYINWFTWIKSFIIVYEVHSTIIYPGSWFLYFTGKLGRTKTQQGTDKSSKHNVQYNSWVSTGSGINFVLSFFILLSLCVNYQLFPLSIASVSRRCCCGPPLKYHVRYGRSRHRCRFRNPTSNILGGPLLCWTLCCVRRRQSHWSRRSAIVVPLSKPLEFSHPILL